MGIQCPAVRLTATPKLACGIIARRHHCHCGGHFVQTGSSSSHHVWIHLPFGPMPLPPQDTDRRPLRVKTQSCSTASLAAKSMLVENEKGRIWAIDVMPDSGAKGWIWTCDTETFVEVLECIPKGSRHAHEVVLPDMPCHMACNLDMCVSETVNACANANEMAASISEFCSSDLSVKDMCNRRTHNIF